MAAACDWFCRVHSLQHAETLCPYNDVWTASFDINHELLKRTMERAAPELRAKLQEGPGVRGAQYLHLVKCLGRRLSYHVDLNLELPISESLTEELRRIGRYVQTIVAHGYGDLRVQDAFGRSGLLRIAELHYKRPQDGLVIEAFTARLLRRSFDDDGEDARIAQRQAWMRGHMPYSQELPWLERRMREETTDRGRRALLDACLFPHHVSKHNQRVPLRLRALAFATPEALKVASDPAWVSRVVLVFYHPSTTKWDVEAVAQTLRVLVDEVGVRNLLPWLLSYAFYRNPQLDGIIIKRLKSVNKRRVIAIAMALHPRLGARSRLSILGGDVLHLCAVRYGVCVWSD